MSAPMTPSAPAAPLEALEALFDAENHRDWETFAAFLHPDVEWALNGRLVRGRQACIATLQDHYRGSGARFRLHQLLDSDDGTTVAALLVNSAGERSLEVFEVVEGLIRREWEFELGPGADWNGSNLHPAAGGDGLGRVALTGLLVCNTQEQAAAVRELLPEHIAKSRAESGCLSFDIRRTHKPLVWQVDEVFADAAAFKAHQERAAASEWGRATRGVERRYEITEGVRAPGAPWPRSAPTDAANAASAAGPIAPGRP